MTQGFTHALTIPVPVTQGGTGLIATTINQLLYSSAANTIAGLTTANNSILVTSAGGVPSWATTLPAFTTSSITFSPTTGGLVGTTTNDNAAAGKVGEYIGSNIAAASAININNATETNLTSISLTAGDWDVWGNITYIPTGLSNNFQSSISLVSSTGSDGSLKALTNAAATSGVPWGHNAPNQRLSLSGTTTIYLVGFLAFTTGTATFCGNLGARRAR